MNAPVNHAFLAGAVFEIHHFEQGSEEWLQFRATHYGASEAAAMLGISRKTSRNELLRAKKTLMPKEFCAWVQEHILDHGHEVEAMARMVTEAEIGDSLYTDTFSVGKLSYSSDGITMAGEIAWEHKQWNEEYSALVEQGVVPEEHMPQCQQGLLVSGAARLLFTISDGTPDRRVSVWVYPDQQYQNRIVSGWEQFDKDLESFEIVEKEAPVIAAPIESLPVLSVRVDGNVAVRDNLPEFRTKLYGFIEGLNLNPTDDQGFANLDAAAKKLREAESALASAKENVLNQVTAVGTLAGILDDLREFSRKTAIAAEKAVKEGKEARKQAIVQSGIRAIEAHHAGLPHSDLIPKPVHNFSAATKNLRTLDSYQNAVDTHVAELKIQMNALADEVCANVSLLDEEPEFAFLFSDRAQLVLRPADFVALTVRQRIADHKAAEETRLEAERARIRAEEEARANREVEEKAALAKVPGILEKLDGAAASGAMGAGLVAELKETTAAMAAEIVIGAAADTGSRITLGAINSRLSPISITRDGLSLLGFQHVDRDRAAYLYRESDFPAICTAIVAHITKINSLKQAA